jgi:hypothetical protein
MNQGEYYLEMALAAEADARSASLENVRERNLRSAAAWRAMAERALKTDRMRAERAAAVQPRI